MIKCNKKLELEYPDWHTMALNRYMKYDILITGMNQSNFEVINKINGKFRKK